MEYLPFIFIGLFFIFVPVVIIFSIVQQKKRRAAVEQFAREKDWQFTHKGKEFDAQTDLPEFALFKKASVRGVRSVAYGREAGLDVAIGEYVYSTGSGKNRSTHRQTFCLVGLPGSEGEQTFPDFLLAPEHFLHKFADLFGYTDIDFDGHPEFSKRYRLTAENEQPVRELFTREVIRHFEGIRDPRLHIEAHGRWFMLYRTGKPLKIAEWDSLYQETLSTVGVVMPK